MVDIKQALSDIECPVERPPYKFTAETTQFVTFQLISETGDMYAEDDNDVERVLMSVDVFTKLNWIDLVSQVKRKLKAAGYSIIGIGPELYETDTEFYHIPLRVEKIVHVDIEDCD